jgi:hypothetical protein
MGAWQTVYAKPSNFCTPYAMCGRFMVCNGDAMPFCGCMEGFSQRSSRDWELGDRAGGCTRNTSFDISAEAGPDI